MVHAIPALLVPMVLLLDIARTVELGLTVIRPVHWTVRSVPLALPRLHLDIPSAPLVLPVPTVT